jgi:hypothetical protein
MLSPVALTGSNDDIGADDEETVRSRQTASTWCRLVRRVALPDAVGPRQPARGGGAENARPSNPRWRVRYAVLPKPHAVSRALQQRRVCRRARAQPAVAPRRMTPSAVP